MIFITNSCILYTSDAADEEDSVDLGGRRIIKKNHLFCWILIVINKALQNKGSRILI